MEDTGRKMTPLTLVPGNILILIKTLENGLMKTALNKEAGNQMNPYQ
jgi:hypothetical protein